MTNVAVAISLTALLAAASAPLVATPAASDACRQVPNAPSQYMTAESGYSVRLGRFDGILYYTVGHDGYHLVATFVSGSDQSPIRLVAALKDGQHVTISVPRQAGEPSIDLMVTRASNTLLLGYASACIPTS